MSRSPSTPNNSSVGSSGSRLCDVVDGEHACGDTDRHHNAGNSSDFWYAELTVSGMPQYLNSE